MAQPSTPEQQQYVPHNKQIPPTAQQGTSPPGGHNLAFLPFTGLDLGVMALAAAVLLASGFGLKRLAGPRRREGA